MSKKYWYINNLIENFGTITFEQLKKGMEKCEEFDDGNDIRKAKFHAIYYNNRKFPYSTRFLLETIYTYILNKGDFPTEYTIETGASREYIENYVTDFKKNAKINEIYISDNTNIDFATIIGWLEEYSGLTYAKQENNNSDINMDYVKEIAYRAKNEYKKFYEMVLKKINKKLKKTNRLKWIDSGQNKLDYFWIELRDNKYANEPYSISLTMSRDNNGINLSVYTETRENLTPEQYKKFSKSLNIDIDKELGFYYANEYYEKICEDKIEAINKITKGLNYKIIIRKVIKPPYTTERTKEIVAETANAIESLLPNYLEIFKGGTDNMTQPLNQILYGPPGTGKTYNTVVKAIEIIEPECIEWKNKDDHSKGVDNYDLLKKKFDDYKKDGRIEFITFHQSYSYEEFVEGIKPYIPKEVWRAENIDKIELPEVKYLGKKGVFREICDRAANLYFDEAINIFKELHPQGSDFENLLSLDYEKEENKIYFNYGQSKTNQQRFFPLEHLKHYYDENVIFEKPEDLYNKMLDDFQYKIKLQSYNFTFYNKLLRIKEENKYKPYVLIIDEINRGNISKIFGELITLIEEDKRAGEDNAITVTLPYSGESFSVPNNLYIIGTMNTSDRSIASVDIALRRRFKFVEMMPEPERVPEYFRDKFKILNKKISILLDRDHQIGHSYFIDTQEKDLEAIWFDSIIPLLNEYFYGDWEKLQEILGKAEEEKDKKEGDKFTSFIKKLDYSCINNANCYDSEDDCYDYVRKDEIDFDNALDNAFKKEDKK